MTVTLHWFLPTNGDSRSDLSLGNAVGVRGGRIGEEGGEDRAPSVGYIGQIARSAEQLGFDAALTPTSSWCEDAWVMTAALTQVTERFRFLVAFRPGLTSPTLAAQMAATFQRVSGGRLLLNVVTGGDDREQRRFGDSLSKDERYARAGEFLTIVRRLWHEESVDFSGEHYQITDAQIVPHPVWPELYFGGSSDAAIEVGRGPRRRLPDLGRAAGGGRREDRPGPRAGRRTGPRAALRDPPARHHPRHQPRRRGGRPTACWPASPPSRSRAPRRSSAPRSPRDSAA